MKRPNGTGNVYKPTGRNTWTARVVDHWEKSEGSVSGIKPVWKTKGGFRSKKDAINYLPIIIAQAPKATKKTAPTLESYWASYETNDLPKLSKSKQTAYRIAWNRLEGIHNYPVDMITVGILRDTVSAASDSYYPARDCKVLLSHLFKLAGADGWASKDLPSYIVLPDLEEKEREVFSLEEQEALWHVYESGNIDACIPLAMIYTGMMPGELYDLKTENIDLESGKIEGAGKKTKVRKASPIYIPKDVVPVFQDLISAAQPSGYLFKRMEDVWRHRYYAALEAAGCRKLEPYCCRHSMATRLAITEGIAPQTVQRIMRWSSTKMLDRYAHPDSEDVKTAVEKVKRGL